VPVSNCQVFAFLRGFLIIGGDKMKAVELLHDIIWLECDKKANNYIKLLFEKIQKGFTEQEKTDLKKFALVEMHKGLFKFVAMVTNGEVCYDWVEKTLIKIREDVK
jgi:hypothetical protein